VNHVVHGPPAYEAGGFVAVDDLDGESTRYTRRYAIQIELEAAQDGDDLADDAGVVAVDGGEVLVGRQQLHVAVLLLERLHGGLVVEHRGHDVAVDGVLLAAHDHPVAVADCGLDHRLADDLEQEQLAVAHERLRQREDLLDRLLGEDRAACGDAADHRHVRRLGHRIADAGDVVALAGVDDLHRARQARVAADVALLLQRGELVGDRRRRGEADGVADLAHRRRVAAWRAVSVVSDM